MGKLTAAPGPEDPSEEPVEPGTGLETTDEDFDEVGKPSQRARATVELMLRGATPAEVADIQGYPTPAAAAAAFNRTIAWMTGPPEAYAAAQKKIVMQLDLGLKSLAQRALNAWIIDPNDPEKKRKIANDQHIAYNREWRATLMAKAEILGVKAPTRVQIDTPEASKVDEIVRAVVAAQRGEAPPEGDPFSMLIPVELRADKDGVYRADFEPAAVAVDDDDEDV